jgi:hypothetical protein
MLVKLYGNTDPESERRYSPATCIGTIPTAITGHPDPDHISTSYVERQNWTVRTTMRRCTRLSNGSSRKIENHLAASLRSTAGYWEPDELRGSRPVLGERGGATPPRHSTEV